MRTELIGQEKNIVTLKLEFEPDEFNKALKKTLNELAQQVNIPGFRKGHAPRNILEMRFGREAIYNETLEKLVPENLRQIIDDYDLEPLESPELRVTEEIKENQVVKCELIVEVRPEIELPEIQNLEIEKVITSVSDADVDKLINRILIQNSEVKPVERPINDGDLIDVDLTIKILKDDGSEAPEEEQVRKNPSKEKINLSDETVRAQVREALINHSKDETVEAVFDVEAGHPDSSLSGKKVKYIMKIEGVSEFVKPELNQDFYKKLFGNDTDILTDEAFRTRLHNDIFDELSEQHENDIRNRAIALVSENSKLEIPEKLINRQIQAMRKDDENWAKTNNVSLTDTYALNTKEGREGYSKLLRARAEASVRDVLVMDEAAKKYDIQVENEDLEEELKKRAKRYRLDFQTVANYFYKNKEQLERLMDEIRYQKVADALVSDMKIKEVTELSKPNEANQANQEIKSENQPENPENGGN